MPPLGSPPHGGGSAPAGAPYLDPHRIPRGRVRGRLPYGSAQMGFAPLPPPGRAGWAEAAAAAWGRGGKRWSPNRRFGRLDGRVEALPFRIQFDRRVALMAPFVGGPPVYQRVM